MENFCFCVGNMLNFSVEVQITTPAGTLYGTQIIPTSDAPQPVVLIVAGSGPTDRNGKVRSRAGITLRPSQLDRSELLSQHCAPDILSVNFAHVYIIVARFMNCF